MSVSRKNKRPKNFFPERKSQTSTKTMTLESQSAYEKYYCVTNTYSNRKPEENKQIGFAMN
jgi:hypothetical protein